MIIKQYDEKIEHLSKLLEEGNVDNVRKSQMDCKCNVCGKDFAEKTVLKEHIKKEHPQNYKCKICNKNFETSWQMETHMRSHDEAETFKCNKCEKKFYVLWRLKKHAEGHTPEKLSNDFNFFLFVH